MIAPIDKVRGEGNCGRATDRGEEACECVGKLTRRHVDVVISGIPYDQTTTARPGARYGMDIVEVSPPYDHAEITSLAAATLGLEFLYVLAANRKAN